MGVCSPVFPAGRRKLNLGAEGDEICHHIESLNHISAIHDKQRILCMHDCLGWAARVSEKNIFGQFHLLTLDLINGRRAGFEMCILFAAIHKDSNRRLAKVGRCGMGHPLDGLRVRLQNVQCEFRTSFHDAACQGERFGIHSPPLECGSAGGMEFFLMIHHGC